MDCLCPFLDQQNQHVAGIEARDLRSKQYVANLYVNSKVGISAQDF